MTDRERKEHLKQVIADAFAEVPYPGDNALLPDPIDEIAEEEQDHPRQRAFQGYHWRNLPSELIVANPILLVRPEARRFYLPAYLFQAIDRIEETMGTPYVVLELTPPPEMGRFKREYDAYSPAQRNAIRLFLEYVRDRGGKKSSQEMAQDALDRYWCREGNESSAGEPDRSAELTEKDRLKQAIRAAFAEVPYPGDKNIGYEPLESDAAEINQNFATYHWLEVPHSVLAYHNFDFPLFSKQGRQFYLPAFLLDALEDWCETRDQIVYCLAPTVAVQWPYRDDDLYTEAQRDVIRRFLEYVHDTGQWTIQHHARVALDMIWARTTPWPGEGSPESTTDPVRKEQVKQAILEAFADVPYPGDDAILSESPTNDSPYTQEAKMLQDFKGANARALPRKVLLEHHNPFLTFSAEALQYYLPAYLIAALENIGDIVFWVVFFLDPGNGRLAWVRRTFDRYPQAQKNAIRLFLEYVRDAMPHVTLGDVAQRSIDQYWGTGAP